MRQLAALVIALAACADDPLPPFEAAVKTFTDAACTTACVVDEAACREDVAIDMAMAKELLDDDVELRCALCLETKASIIPDVVDCQPSAEQNAEVYRVCDLDPLVDFDRDLDPANDDDEACGGFP